MKDRIEEFLSSEGITKAQFADSINVARAAISHILAGRNKPSYEFIVNTMNTYPSLNIEWLLNGEGSMYKGETDGADTKKTTTAYVKRIIVYYSDGTFREFTPEG